jgi:hypothetical protein
VAVHPVETINDLTSERTQSYSPEAASIGLAPIALFAYNRPDHLRRTVEGLRENTLACQSDLHIFSDGTKSGDSSNEVEEVRRFIHKIDGFRSVTIVERPRNFGLAASIIDGITQLCNRFGQVIAVEDDLLTAPDFLRFLNAALDRYRLDSQVFSIGAINFAIDIPQDYPWDAFFSYRNCSIGWATWKDRWQKADWKVADYIEFRSDRERLRKFCRGGGDLPRMLAKQMSGQLDSWAIRWAYTHAMHDALALMPAESRVYHIGYDGSGTHSHVPLPQGALASGSNLAPYRLPDSIVPEASFAKQIRKMYPGSFAGRLRRYVKCKLAARLSVSH